MDYDGKLNNSDLGIVTVVLQYSVFATDAYGYVTKTISVSQHV